MTIVIFWIRTIAGSTVNHGVFWEIFGTCREIQSLESGNVDKYFRK